MPKKITPCFGSVLLVFLCASLAQGQAVFTYGNSAVDKAAFLRAYTKNNPDQKATEKSVRDYLELLIRFKLKVKEAYAKKMDTLANQRSELAEFRRQIAENYLEDDDDFRNLLKEAFTRSQLDLNMAYLFIPVPSNPGKKGDQSVDTLASRKTAMNAYHELRQGVSFEQVAAKYVANGQAITNAGDPGFITVFTLPYAFENIVYRLPAGDISKPVFTGQGHYIFKNIGSRKAVGKRKVRQVLLTLPIGADSSLTASVHRKADSIYETLTRGVPFDTVTTRFWDARMASGELPLFGVGTYEPAFENAVFALQKDGNVSRPLRTALGFHVVQRIESMPVDADESNEAAMETLIQQVRADSRINVSKKKRMAAINRSVPVKAFAVNEPALRRFADSAFSTTTPMAGSPVNNRTVLFSIGGKNVIVEDWINSMRARNRNSVPAATQYPALLQQFKDDQVLSYYQEHLEDYDPDFAAQVQEFQEGNLLFEIMQRTVWERAAADSMALRKFYADHRSGYWWLPGAEAIVFITRDSIAAFSTRAEIRRNPGGWKNVLARVGDRVQADSGRFEFAQLSMATPADAVSGTLTTPRKIPGSDGYNFFYIIRPYAEKAPRSYEDARGFVTNDYQAYLEDEWVKQLKIKYPVKINEAVVRNLYTVKK